MIVRTGVRAMISAAVGLALVLGGASGASAVPARDAAPSARPTAQKYYWEWSDQHSTLSRTFKKSQFGTDTALPHLLVTVEPASPRRTVTLKFLEDGKWKLEAKEKTDSSGVATLDFIPWCNAAHTKWCNGTWTYKVYIGDVQEKFKIKYSSK